MEDPQQRTQPILELRTLVKAQQATQESGQTVRTAGSEAIEVLSGRVAGVARAAGSLIDTLERLPQATMEAVEALEDPGTRERWITTLGRLFAVLAGGFLAAWIARRLLQPLRRDATREGTPRPLVNRLLHLTGYLLIDLLPILVFAAASYGVLALVDPRQETRYVAVILVNASVLSRLVLAASAFFFAPDTPAARLWGLADETAQYVHQWVKRLSMITVYGFFGLEAALYLGLADGAYQMLLRLLGLVVLGLLLVLVAQNRLDVANAIAGPTGEVAEGARGEALRPLSTMRKGLARVWHLIAGL